MKITKSDFIKLGAVICSSLIYSLSMKVFVNSGDLFPGGFSGLSYLIIRTAAKYFSVTIPFGLIYVLLNIFPTILVFKKVGHRFAVFSVIQYLLVSLFTTLLPDYTLTDDLLLIAVFGGIVAGFGTTVALNNGASSGGTDFIAIYFSEKYNRSTWSYILAFNTCVLIISGFLFSWNTALYSIIFQFCYTQIVNLRHNRYQLTTLMIITRKPDEVDEALLSAVRHGVTIFKATGGYKHKEESVLMMTINSYQEDLVIKRVKEVDPEVFINIFHTEKIVGNYYKAPLG